MITFETGRTLDAMMQRVRDIKRAQCQAQRYYDAPEETQRIRGRVVTFIVGRCRVSHGMRNYSNHQTGPESWKLDGKRISYANLLVSLSE